MMPISKPRKATLTSTMSTVHIVGLHVELVPRLGCAPPALFEAKASMSQVCASVSWRSLGHLHEFNDWRSLGLLHEFKEILPAQLSVADLC